MSERGGVAHVLVVDDDADHTGALAALLALHGWTASRAHSGTEALEAMAVGNVDAAICDLSLGGGMSGIDVARDVRARHGTRVALLAYTGNGSASERAAAHAAGFDAFLLKPATLPVIVEAIAAVLSARPDAAVSGAT